MTTTEMKMMTTMSDESGAAKGWRAVDAGRYSFGYLTDFVLQ